MSNYICIGKYVTSIFKRCSNHLLMHKSLSFPLAAWAFYFELGLKRDGVTYSFHFDIDLSMSECSDSWSLSTSHALDYLICLIFYFQFSSLETLEIYFLVVSCEIEQTLGLTPLPSTQIEELQCSSP